MLELAVLGLLKERPMHGYQLSRELGDSLGGLWRVSYGSLYPTLRRLERDAAIESEDGDVRGARRKKVYRITPKGEQIFLELLQETPQDTQTRGRPVPDAPGVLPLPAARDPHPVAGATPAGAAGAPRDDRGVAARRDEAAPTTTGGR